MAKSYLGKAPLSLVPTTNGAMAYVYAGQPAPEGIVPEDLKRLVKDGYLVEVASVEEPPPADNPDGGAQRPKATATKAVWAEFRGLTEEQAKYLTIDQLKDDAFMASHPAQPAA